jgi:hypothetical protein
MMTFEMLSFKHTESRLSVGQSVQGFKIQSSTVELALTATRYCKLGRYPKPYLLRKDGLLAGVFQRQAAADAFTPGYHD